MNREEIIRRLAGIEDRLSYLKGMTEPTHDSVEEEKQLEGEYKKLFYELSLIPICLGNIIVRKKIVLELDDPITKEVLDLSKYNSIYFGGKASKIEKDENGIPKKLKTVYLDPTVKQLVPAYYNIQIVEELPKPKEEPKKEPIKPAPQISQLPVPNIIDWMMEQWECPVCKVKMYNSVDLCKNCAQGKREDAGKSKPKDKDKGQPKRVFNQAFGFRSFLRKEKTTKEKRVENQYNKD
jgi:hypothetical protein